MSDTKAELPEKAKPDDKPPIDYEYSKTWQQKANSLARGYCPPIRPCRDCREPVVLGYCCTFCHSHNP